MKFVLGIILLFSLNTDGVCRAKQQNTKLSATTKQSTLQIESITINVENRNIFNVKSYLFKGARYISVPDLSSIYSGWINWYPVSGRVILNVAGNKIGFSINSREVKINTTHLKMKKSAELIRDEICVPIEFLLTSTWSNIVKGETYWDLTSKTLSFNTQFNLSLPRIYTTPKRTRIVLELAPDFKYEIISSTGNELLLSVFDGKSERGATTLAINDGRVDKIEIEQQSYRVVYKIVSISDQFKPELSDAVNPKRLFVTYSSPVDYSTSLSSITITSIGKRRIQKIVIDPGHGGKDGGALGRSGTKEKDINITLAKELARILEEEYEYKVILTRNDDTFVPLYDRTQLANKEKANLFVSIHCNGSLDPNANGFEVYFLSETATDAQAESVAEAENAVIALEEVDANKMREREKILLSLEINAYMNQSSELAALMAKQVCNNIEITNNGVKQANFLVLRGARMPAILLETGYISCSREEKKLNKRYFQNKIVDVWVKGILDYEQRLNKE